MQNQSYIASNHQMVLQYMQNNCVIKISRIFGSLLEMARTEIAPNFTFLPSKKQKEIVQCVTEQMCF